MGFCNFLYSESESFVTTSFVAGSSGIEDVISRLSIVKAHFPEEVFRPSIYESCLKSEPDRRTGIPFTTCLLYFCQLLSKGVVRNDHGRLG